MKIIIYFAVMQHKQYPDLEMLCILLILLSYYMIIQPSIISLCSLGEKHCLKYSAEYLAVAAIVASASINNFKVHQIYIYTNTRAKCVLRILSPIISIYYDLFIIHRLLLIIF
jgi:hypothetical protein